MTGIPLIIMFVLAIVLMIYSISKLKVHPFISIMVVSVLFAGVAGIPLEEIPGIVGTGFSNTFKSIGIVIILGALIGTLLEKTGAALKMADVVVKVVGERNPELAMLIMGWIISIPVFCDSGFVMLNPIRKALVQRTKKSSVATTVALSMGLYVAHCFIPPTPGPIAAANTIYEGINIPTNLLLVMIFGVICSILPLTASYFYAKFIGKRVKSRDELEDSEELMMSYDEIVASYGKLPSAFLSFAPIVAPILLMGISSALDMMGKNNVYIQFLGTPIIAISVGVIFAVILLANQNMMKDFNELTNDTLKIAGPILFVTAAGGVLGAVISNTSLVEFITENSNVLATMGIFFPFILAAILKTSLGSSTVAITTTAGILAPMMATLNLATSPLAALTVIAIGAGAMTVSHANDSYFWVVTNFGELEVEDGYKAQTMGTLVLGIAAIINVFIVYLFIR